MFKLHLKFRTKFTIFEYFTAWKIYNNLYSP